MRAVNLLPRDVQPARTEGGRAPLLVAGGGIAAVTAASIVMFFSASGSISDQRAQLESVEAAIARLPKREAPVVAPGAIAQERSNRLAALSAALATRVPVDRLLREIAYVLPEDSWLTGLTAAVPASATGAGPGAQSTPSASSTPDVTVLGATYSQASVARVLSRLAAIPTLDDVRLVGSATVVIERQKTSKAKPVKQKIVTFTIGANLRAGRST